MAHARRVVRIADGRVERDEMRASRVEAGALLGMGRRPLPGLPVSLRSEFGSYPDFYYLMYRVYF
jgi:hypothetical protein